jgi:hypothetical protein
LEGWNEITMFYIWTIQSKWQVLDSRKVSVERLRPSISALVYSGTLCCVDDSTNGWRFQQSWSETIESSASGGHVSQRLWFGIPTTLWTCHLYLFLHFTRCVQFLIGHCHQCLRLSTNVDTDIEETCEIEFTWNSLVWRTCKLKILCHGCVVLCCMHSCLSSQVFLHACMHRLLLCHASYIS